MFRFRLRQSARVSLCLIVAAVSVVAVSPAPVLEWVVVAPNGEGFSVNMPVKPSEETTLVPLADKTYRLRIYTSNDAASGLLFVTSMQECPPIMAALDPAAKLEKFADGFKSGFSEGLPKTTGAKFEMLVDKELKLSGHIGRQYKLNFADLQGLLRVFDGGQRVYFLMVMGANDNHADVNRFFNSFQLKAAPDPVPQPAAKP